MTIKKRCLLWDWTNTDGPGHAGVPWAMDKVHFEGPISSVSNWNTWTPPELKGRVPFRPVVRLEAQLSGGDWANIESSNQPLIHFFNEPERAGITPEHAADLWVQKMLPLREHKGKKLASPSCADDEAGQAWINEFMKRVAGHPPDYLGLHYYGTDGNAAIEYLKSMYEKHPHQPIIVTEIASTSRQKNDVIGFTAQLVNWMDETPWVFEYGFFGCMRQVADSFVSPEAQLMNPDGSFTDLMYKLMYDQPIKL
ncbi:hypothetical protein MMC34_005733 [Xylographa carneopallida]|nr:hypothetical protein [Xylographa carneopallida]